MIEYVSVNETKSFLGLTGVEDYDEKIQVLVDGVNYDVSEYINDEPENAKIKMNVLRLCEYYWMRTTGVANESEGSGGAYKITFEEVEKWPSEIKAVFDEIVSNQNGEIDEDDVDILELI